MTEYNDIKLPTDLQSFEKTRKGRYAYADKTDITWRLAKIGKYPIVALPVPCNHVTNTL